jgi:hypothetical protein
MQDAREDTTDAPGRHHWHRGPRPKPAVTSEEQEDIWRDLQEDFRAAVRQASSRDVQGVAESEGLDIVRNGRRAYSQL